MSEPVMSFEEKQKFVQEYIRKHDPYAPKDPFRFRMREYVDYIQKHNIKTEDISDDLMSKFLIRDDEGQ